MNNTLISVDEHTEAVIECLCREYQSVWIVDLDTNQMCIYKANEELAIPESIKKAVEIGCYSDARNWYIDNYVVEEHKERLRTETDFENVMNMLSKAEMYYVDYRRINDETVNYNQLVYSAICNADKAVTHLMLGFRDIDSKKKAEKDDLTGLYTRRAFIEYAEKRLEDNPDTNYKVIITDIVDFKQINEEYGIRKGDDILRWMGKKLRDSIAGDMIVGRYGGDQFAVMISEETEKFFTDTYGNRLFKLENPDFPKLNIKFGIYNSGDRSLSVTTMCDYAHLALNSIKQDYSQKFAVYDEKFIDNLSAQRKIESSMHDALKTDQFKVYYQPKHDAASGKLVGAEALVRWIHPEYGFMSPGEFIPLFEKNGFVSEVDKYVFERTCKNIKSWTKKGINPVPISVNASKRDFKSKNLLTHLENVAGNYNIPRKLLHIEVTETLMEDDVEGLSAQLKELRDAGYKIELDDFGTGYSSINNLSQIPLDVIKLDMSFMKQIDDIKRKKVLAACIGLAKSLGYTTVSEGVESQDQLDTLKKLGVDTVQGYYFSKPLPEEEFERYLQLA